MVGKRRSTYADLEKLPENMVGELIDGELFASPRPRPGHARAAGVITRDVGGPFDFDRDGPGGWWILPEPQVHLAMDVVVPDLAGWRRSRMPVPPQNDIGIEVPPDWKCEVLSPSNARLDRRMKMPLYAKFGVSHLWLVDPPEKLVEVYRLENGRWLNVVNAASDEKVRLEPFEQVELDLSRWWFPDPPAAP